MKKVILIALCMMALVGCESQPQPKQVGIHVNGWSIYEVCFDGVTYYESGRGSMTPKFDQHSHVVTCKSDAP